jgi:predicted ATPase
MREMSIEVLAQVVVQLLAEEPAVFAVEDAHWCDATTREWLGVLRAALKNRLVLMFTTTLPGLMHW